MIRKYWSGRVGRSGGGIGGRSGGGIGGRSRGRGRRGGGGGMQNLTNNGKHSLKRRDKDN